MNKLDPNCVFCQKPATDILLENTHAKAFWDIRPVSKGHLLVVPKRHMKQVWDLEEVELKDIERLITDAKAMLDKQFKPEGYNIAINAGAAAGQTVFHCHIHLIPRYWNQKTQRIDNKLDEQVGGQFLVPPERPQFRDQ